MRYVEFLRGGFSHLRVNICHCHHAAQVRIRGVAGHVRSLRNAPTANDADTYWLLYLSAHRRPLCVVMVSGLVLAIRIHANQIFLLRATSKNPQEKSPLCAPK
jgi:hypothetical protein